MVEKRRRVPRSIRGHVPGDPDTESAADCMVVTLPPWPDHHFRGPLTSRSAARFCGSAAAIGWADDARALHGMRVDHKMTRAGELDQSAVREEFA